MSDRSLVMKYLKVVALAQRGSPGERDNAAALVRKLETAHPGIRDEAERFLRQQKTDSTPSGVWPKDKPTTATNTEKQVGNWENIFRYAQTAINGAYHFAGVVYETQRGYQLGNHLSIKTTLSKKGDIRITLIIDPRTYTQSLRLSEVQRRAFKEKAHDLLSAQLERLFNHNQ